MPQPIKIAITGAAGQIGYATLFRLASGEIFGHQQPIELHLLELEAAQNSLRGVVMELEDCAFPLLKNIVYTSDVNVAMRDVNWAILIGAVPRKAGMERADLLQINGGIFTTQGRALNEHAAKDIRVLVVGNPCNTNALIAMNNAPNIPKDRFYAMTMLDELRARTQIAIKAGVDVDTITHMNVWGNHSATQYPDFYDARINNKPVTDVITDHEWLKTTFLTTVQQRGAEVIKTRGASSAASAANAALMTVYNLVHDTPKNDSFSVSICSQGQYGIDEGLIFSFPCRTDQGKLTVITDRTHNEFSKQKIDLTLNELRQERDTVKELKLI